MKKISIVIVTYNSTRDIRECLRSIYVNNDIGKELEVIIVDNNSSDIHVLKKILLNEFPEVLLIENSSNGGYGQGNNIGIHNSKAPIIMIMNPDVRLYEPIFSKIYKIFHKDELLGMLGIRQYEAMDIPGNSFMPCGHSLSNFIRYIYCKRRGLFNGKYLMISGACFFINKEHFISIGGFDEKIFMYGEEYDINIRMNKSPYSIKFDYNMGYIHPVHERDITNLSEEVGYKSLIYTRTKHGVSIKKELINTILILNIMLLRSIFIRDYRAIRNYSVSIKFYMSKLF